MCLGRDGRGSQTSAASDFPIMEHAAYRPASVNDTVGDLPTCCVTLDVSRTIAELKAYLDEHTEVPGVLLTGVGSAVVMISRDVLYHRLSQAFGREIFLRRSIAEFLEVFPQTPLVCKSTCTVNDAMEMALNRPAATTYEPLVIESPAGELGLLEMHALLVAQSQLLALTRLIDQQRAAAEAANHSKSEFLANISHELRTPLHGIASYARFGKDEAGDGDRGELRQYFVNVEQCVDSLLLLVNDLLDLSKLEAGRMRYDFARASLGDLASAVVDEFNSTCAGRNLAIRYVPADADTTARLDPERFKQVLRNLLSNAVKFSPDGGRIVVRLRMLGKLLLLSVRDEGPGIPPDELELIFDKFVQSSKTKSGSGGTGLGLAISREIVAGHQGRIWAENNDGPGATFYCEIPAAPAAEATDDEPRAEDAAIQTASLT